MEFKHYSVMLSETIDGLLVKSGGIYVDGTLGGGGHSLDVLLRVNGLSTTVYIEEELAAFGLVQAFFVAGRITELAGGALGDQLGRFGIILNFANNFLHFSSSFAKHGVL